MDELRRLVRRGDFGLRGVGWYHSRGHISDDGRDELLNLVAKYEEVRERRDYSWMTPEWIVQAERCEKLVRPAITRRRWTDKDDIVTDYVVKHDWPIIPKGVGAHFEGERALRIFIEITDGDEEHEAPKEAVLVARISGDDADRAWLTKKDEFLVVPAKIFVWVAGALSFDKKVLLTLNGLIEEHRLTHADAEIWPEIVWIAPIKAEDREQYYAIMPLPGLPGVIDPERGNPSLYRPLQKRLGWNPYRNIIWQIVDEIIDGGISTWGERAASGNGQASIFLIKLRLVNFLRAKATVYAEEELARMERRGELARTAVFRAISNGFGKHHLPEPDRIALVNHWLKEADEAALKQGILRLVRAFRSYNPGNAAAAILHGYGIGWAEKPQDEANRLMQLAWLCSRMDFLARVARIEFEGEDSGSRLDKESQEAYEDGKISPRELAATNDELGISDEWDADNESYRRNLAELETWIAYLTQAWPGNFGPWFESIRREQDG